MILVEAVPQVYGYLSPSDNLITMVGGTDLANAIIISQLFMGAFLVFLMDELISKWGIGSGISLFIGYLPLYCCRCFTVAIYGSFQLVTGAIRFTHEYL